MEVPVAPESPQTPLTNCTPKTPKDVETSQSGTGKNKYKTKKSRFELSLHRSSFQFNWDDDINHETQDTYAYLTITGILLLYVWYCIPHILFDLNTNIGMILQNIFIIPGAIGFPFFVIRATLRIDINPFPGLYYSILIFLIFVNLLEYMFICFNISPLPFRIVIYSVLWFIVVPISHYIMSFRYIHSVTLKRYAYSWLIVLFFPSIFYLCMGFVFAFNYFSYSTAFNDKTSSFLQTTTLLIFEIICWILKLYAPDIMSFVQHKCNQNLSQYNLSRDGGNLAVLIAPISLLFGCDWIQSYFVLVVLKDSSGIGSIITMCALNISANLVRTLLILPSVRIYINARIAPKFNWLPTFINDKIYVPESDKTGTFKEGLHFGMSTIASTLANISAIFVMLTIYYSKNKDLYYISKIPQSKLTYSYIGAVSDCILSIISTTIVHFYFHRKLKLCNPVHSALLYLKYNYQYIVCCLALGLMFGLSVLGKHWNALYFMINWLVGDDQ